MAPAALRRSARLTKATPNTTAPSPQSSPTTSNTSIKVRHPSKANPTKAPKITNPPRRSAQAPSPQTIEFPSPSAFNTWLLQHGLTTPQGLWLQMAKKTSPTRSITYDQAVDTALCHGWIDGQRRALSPSHFTQRFTPRRKRSLWSRRNVDKVAVLTEQGRMQPAGLAEVRAAMADGRWERAYEGSATMQVPADFEAALRGSEDARAAFERLGKGARYPFLWRIVTLHGEARARKIGVFVDMLARGETL